MDAYRHTIIQQQAQVEDEDELQEPQVEDEEDQEDSEKENHVIVILPFGGHVWEIDSYCPEGPLDLGLCGESWTTVAATRLQMWHGTTAFTRVSVDIQAILKSS